MSSTPQERLQAIEDNYDDASENEAHDLALQECGRGFAGIQANVRMRDCNISLRLPPHCRRQGTRSRPPIRQQKAQMRASKMQAEAAALPDLLKKLTDASTKAERC